jgi:chorismate mutase/prephenate dehydratase
MSEIEQLRKKIDQLDSQILELINQRMTISIEIGKIKHKNNTQIIDPEREEHIAQRLISLNPGPTSKDAIQSIFKEIVLESRRIQSDTKME